MSRERALASERHHILGRDSAGNEAGPFRLAQDGKSGSYLGQLLPIVFISGAVYMCFSASASFIAGGILATTGVVTLRRTSRRTEIPFAAIPLLFGIQQITEGFIWLSLDEGSASPEAGLTFLYSLFSHVLWPMFVPYAVGRLEKIPWRKRALAVCQAAGVVVGLYLLYFLVAFPVTARVVGKHIVYDSPHFYIVPVMAFYLVATCGSCLLSRHRLVQVFGVMLFVTFTAAYIIHAATLVSMWCFFAALLSLIVFFFIRRTRVIAGSNRAIA